tara:strand:- start:888 stop:1073 length:186 start_codon:yes stop_codon:yes gene_type:complete
MNNLSMHNVKSIKVTLPKRRNNENVNTEYTTRELEITTEDGRFNITLFGDTIEDIKMHMEL